MRLLATDGNAQYWQGDSRTMDGLADDSVHLVATSPPYWNARPEYSEWPTYAAYLADMALVYRECFRVLCDGGRIAVNVPLGYGRPSTGGYISIGDDTGRLIEAAGFTLRGHIIWDKGAGGQAAGTAWGSWLSPSNPSLRDGHEVIIVGHKSTSDRVGAGQSSLTKDVFMAATNSVWRITPAHHPWHPAPWPSEIPERLIHLYTYTGDVVLDPFAGSFTTVAAAARLGRIGIGVELSEEYIERAVGPMFVPSLPT